MVLIKFDNANVSGSENGVTPQKVSEHGCFDAPTSKIHDFNDI